MKLGIVGSRNFTDHDLMVGALLDFKMWDDKTATYISYWNLDLVSGGAEGADTMAADLWRQEHRAVTEHLPDVEKYGWPAAAFFRNDLIVKEADVLLAFFGPGEPPSVNKSGTMDSVRKAMKKRIPVFMYFQQEEVVGP